VREDFNHVDLMMLRSASYWRFWDLANKPYHSIELCFLRRPLGVEDSGVIVIVNSKLLKRYSKAKGTRAPAYSRALRRIKGGFQRGSREAQVRAWRAVIMFAAQPTDLVSIMVHGGQLLRVSIEILERIVYLYLI